jgi:hypothetical protein
MRFLYPCFCLLAFVPQLSASGNIEKFEPETSIAILGSSFIINGELTYPGPNQQAHGLLMNARMVNAVFDDENPETRPEGFDPDSNTTAFIAAMDQYRSKGILAFTINLQGGMPGYENAHNSAFKPDGSLKPGYMNRVARVIEAADEQGMVIIVGYFYQRQDQVLQDEKAVRQATVNASSWLKDRGYSNVMVEIANEYRHPGFDHEILISEEGEVALMSLVRSVAPNIPVSTAGMGDARFHPDLAEAADYILLHGNTSDPEEYPERIKAVSVYGKPVIFNEDWCFSDDTRGVYDAVEKMKAAFKNGASWGVMNQKRNQTWPFEFTIGSPGEDANAEEDFRLYQAMAEMLGIAGPNQE